MNIDEKKMNDKKEKIVSAAIKLFTQKSFSSVSTREIALHAGVNLSLISYYFKTKDNLYSTIIASIINHGLEFLRSNLDYAQDKMCLLNQEEKQKCFRDILYRYIDFIYSENVPEDFILLMIKEQTNQNSKYSKIYRDKINILYDVLKKLLASSTKRTTNDFSINAELCLIITQILSFRLVGPTFDIKNYTESETKKIKSILHQQIDNLFLRLH